MKKNITISKHHIYLLLVLIGGIVLILGLSGCSSSSEEKNDKASPFGVSEKTDEEKYEYLDTMTSEEIDIIVKSDTVEAYYNKELFSYQIDRYYVALHELRFAYDYMEKNNLPDMVVFESAEVHYFDRSLLNETGPDSVIFHLADDEKKAKTQIHMYLEVIGDEVKVINEDRLKEYINGETTN